MPPPSQWSAGLLEHLPLWSPGWAGVLQGRAVQHTGTRTWTRFLIELSHVLFSVGSSVQCDRTMIYLHALEILGPEMRECREKDAWKKQKGLLPLLGSSDVCSSLIHLPRRDVHEDRRQPWLTGAKEDFSVTLVQNEESVDTSSAIPFLLALTPLHLCCSFPPRWELQSRQKNH